MHGGSVTVSIPRYTASLGAAAPRHLIACEVLWAVSDRLPIRSIIGSNLYSVSTKSRSRRVLLSARDGLEGSKTRLGR